MIGEVAARQHGVVAAAQLLERGLSRRMIESRVARGSLHRVHAGVYAVGHPRLTRDGRFMAAVLACGPGAVLSHRSAAALWGIRDSAASGIDVSSPGRAGRSRPGIHAHRRSLDAADGLELRGIPCTSLPRTLLDLAEVVRPSALEYALHRAESAPHRLDLGELRDLVARAPGRRGTRTLRALIEEPVVGAAGINGGLERRFHRLCRRAELPEPRVNAWIPLPIAAGGLEVDFSWPERRVAVETDSRAHHASSRAFKNDRSRDRALTLAGWRVVRYTWWDVVERPGGVVAELRDLLALRAPPEYNG